MLLDISVISVLSKDFHQANGLKPKAQDVPIDSAVFRTELGLDLRLMNTLISSLGVSRLRAVLRKTARCTQRRYTERNERATK